MRVDITCYSSILSPLFVKLNHRFHVQINYIGPFRRLKYTFLLYANAILIVF